MARKPRSAMADFEQRLTDLPSGGELIYHRGQLGHDRRRDAMLNRTACMVADWARSGLGHLVQRRVELDIEYVFVRSAKSRLAANGVRAEAEKC